MMTKKLNRNVRKDDDKCRLCRGPLANQPGGIPGGYTMRISRHLTERFSDDETLERTGDLTMNATSFETLPTESLFRSSWRRLPVLPRSLILGIGVSACGVLSWPIVSSNVPVPWSFVVALAILWLYCRYFSGSWWPGSTAKARQNAFRRTRLKAIEWKWGIPAALATVAIVHASLVLLFRIIPLPAEELTSGYAFGSLAPWLAWASIIVSALFAGICEEVGFRGTMQVPLEQRYGRRIAIGVVSIVFTLTHLHQSWAPWLFIQLFGASLLWGILAATIGSLIPGMIAHTLLDTLAFSYWYSDVGGRFERLTLAQAGIDLHFIFWLLVLVTSMMLFCWFVLNINTSSIESNSVSSDS